MYRKLKAVDLIASLYLTLTECITYIKKLFMWHVFIQMDNCKDLTNKKSKFMFQEVW